MAIFAEIENIIQSVPNLSNTIKSGNKLSPKEILTLSNTFKELNLKNETILLVSFKNSIPKYLITDFNFYVLNEKIKIGQVNSNLLSENRLGLNTDEQKIIISCVSLITSIKTKSTNTLDSFLNKYKSILNQEKENQNNPDLYFDGQYLEMLKHEANEMKNLCLDLNKDPHFIQSLNLIFSSTNEAVDGYKAEHLMISDLIKAYNSVIDIENEKSKFTLAYFFESLQNNDFSNGISIQRLNEMTTKQSFIENIEKIKKAKFINTSKEYRDEYLLPSILFRIKHQSFLNSGNLIYRFASIVIKADGKVNEKEKQALKNILEKTANPIVKSEGVEKIEINSDDSLEIVMSELNSLIGLDEVKKNLKELTNLLKVQKIRTEKGLQNIDIGLHAVFMGPPGTGKTTIARLLGRIYKHLGYLEKGHLIETDRAGIVAGYVGQTALKVNEIVEQSIGGVLFIDEAYSLTPEDGGRDFGNEAVDTLIKRMEDHRKDLVIIVAGYTEPMKLFIESNPGLRSRFNRMFKFNHFFPIQLYNIFELFCKKVDFIISDEAKDKLMDIFEMLYEKRDEGFGNARVVRNIFERCVQSQANRIVAISDITNKILQTIEEQDIPEPKATIEEVYFTKEKNN